MPTAFPHDSVGLVTPQMAHFSEPLALAWFCKLPNCTVLDTTSLTSREAFGFAVEWMDRHGAELATHCTKE